MNKNAVDKLARLLEVERAALLSGNLEAVNALAPEKEALAAGFEGANASDLRSLTSSLERNGVLLAAAREGVSTVLSTLRQQRDSRTSLSSYDSSGKATKISQTAGGTERRF